MKLKIVLLLLLVLSPAFLTAQENDPPAGSTIYFYRLPNYYGAAIQMNILVNEEPVIRLKNGSVYSHEVPPGEYLIASRMATASQLKLKVEPGKSYYVKCYINTGFWTGTPVLELVDPQSGQAVIEGGMLEEQDYLPITAARPRSRLGLVMNLGGGFERIDMGYTDEGDDLTLSTGGGYGIGAEYGFQPGKNFDLSFNLFFQGSILTPAVKNADASFNRLAVTATPALVIPVRGGEYLRFRLGAGPGLYSMGRIKADFSDAGGTEFRFNYKPALGLHASFIFESNFSDRGSFTMGLKYYNIQYKYTTSGSTHESTDPMVVNPDGSGLDFVMGYNFWF